MFHFVCVHTIFPFHFAERRCSAHIADPAAPPPVPPRPPRPCPLHPHGILSLSVILVFPRSTPEDTTNTAIGVVVPSFFNPTKAMTVTSMGIADGGGKKRARRSRGKKRKSAHSTTDTSDGAPTESGATPSSSRCNAPTDSAPRKLPPASSEGAKTHSSGAAVLSAVRTQCNRLDDIDHCRTIEPFSSNVIEHIKKRRARGVKYDSDEDLKDAEKMPHEFDYSSAEEKNINSESDEDKADCETPPRKKHRSD